MGFWYISNRIYLGDKQEGATSPERLRAAKVTHVVNVAGSKFDDFASSSLPIAYATIRLQDREDAHLPLKEALDFTGTATRKGGVVLIHCRGGLSRSCSLVCAHLMAHAAMSLEESVGLIEKARGKQYINEGFMSQLQDLEKSLVGLSRTEHKIHPQEHPFEK